MRWPWQRNELTDQPPARIAASAEMRDYCGFSTMEHPARARAWIEEFLARQPYTASARALFRTLHFEIGDLSQEHGGGYWWAEKRMVQLRGCQDEAAIHELAHAYWEDLRTQNGNADKLIDAVVRLSAEQDPAYARAAQLAHQYVHGIPTQPDPTSPTGYWRGMLVERNDWEMFAGLASGVMADISKLPPYIRPFFAGMFGDRGD